MALMRVEVKGGYYIVDEDTKHFFCRACLMKKPLKDRDKEDWRYCVDCAHFLLTEYRAVADSRGVPLASIYKPVNGSSQEGKNFATGPTLPDGAVEFCDSPDGKDGRRGRRKMALPAARIDEMVSAGMSSRRIRQQLALEGHHVSKDTVARYVRGK